MRKDRQIPLLACCEWMDRTHTELVSAVPRPTSVSVKGRQTFRFGEQTAETLVVAKLARIASGLRAALLLAEAGLFQEQSSLCRLVDEYQEDVAFFALGMAEGKLTRLHSEYLEAFFAEQTSAKDPRTDWVKGRNLVPRKKIRAYLANHDLTPPNPSDHIAVSGLIANTLSGFVHAAADQVMEMYDPCSGRFLTDGHSGTEIGASYEIDLENYFVRGLYAFAFGAAALSHWDLSRLAREYGDMIDEKSNQKRPGHV